MLRRVSFFAIVIIVSLIARTVFSASPSSELIEKGNTFFENRANGHKGDWASTSPIEQALKAYLEAYDPDNPSPELAVKIMDASYFYASYAERDREKQKEALWKAIKIGENILKRYPDSVGIIYWMAGLWGRWGEVNGIFASARKGVANKVRYYAERTIELDPDYADGGGYRALGRLHFKAPWIPMILSWPSKKDAAMYLSKAVKIGPDNLTNRIFYGEALARVGRIQEAIAQLNIVVKAKVNPNKVVEELRDKKEAERLLGRLRNTQE